MEDKKPTEKAQADQNPVSETAEQKDHVQENESTIAKSEEKKSTESNSVPPRRKIFSTKALLAVIFIFILLGVFYLFINYFSNTNPKKNIQTKANSEYQQGQFEISAKTAEDGLKKYPNDPYLLKTIINANSGLGNASGKEKELFEKNKDYISEAEKISQRDVELLLSVGYAYETVGEYSKAIENYDKALSLNPKSGPASFHKGHVLLFLNKFGDAKDLIQKAVSLEPDNSYYKVALGNIFLEEGNTQEALNLYSSAGDDEKSPKQYRSEALTAAGFIYSTNNLMTESINMTQKALQLDPSNAKANALLGFNYLLINKPDEGIKLINKAILLNSRISMNYMMRGMYLRMVGFYSEAVKEQLFGLNKVADDNTLVGEHAKSHATAFMQYELAETYSRMNDNTNALKYLRLAIKNNPLIEDNIEKSIQNDYFSNIKTTSEFTALLK